LSGHAVIDLPSAFAAELGPLFAKLRQADSARLYWDGETSMVQKAKRKSVLLRQSSSGVTEQSDALTLDKGLFTFGDPKRIAASLKRSALRSRRRKAGPFRSALSMLTFYINRAGKNLPAARKKTLVRAKEKLRKQFGKD
jgi:hypothetical protein